MRLKTDYVGAFCAMGEWALGRQPLSTVASYLHVDYSRLHILLMDCGLANHNAQPIEPVTGELVSWVILWHYMRDTRRKLKITPK